MDIMAFVGLGFALVMLVGAFIVEGGIVTHLLEPTAAMIVFGGTIGAVIVSFPPSIVKRIPKIFIKSISTQKIDRMEIIESFTYLGGFARKEGLLALEKELVGDKYDPFIAEGIKLVVDGADEEGIRHVLETKIANMEDRHEKGIAVFEAAGGFGPTMGVCGTVMGMVHVLGDLSDPSALGPKIAVAFIATLYGIGSANLLWLPLAKRLEMMSSEEVITKEMILEGIIMLRDGSNPTFMREQLKGYLEHAEKETESKEG